MVLCQDLDMIWRKDPLTYFLDSTKDWLLDNEWDMFFQDNGARSARFAPFSATSGLYFACHDDRTQELFNARLFTGNQIQRARSDQAVFDALLAEHTPRFGLRVKTLKEEDFPGGRFADDHGQKEYMQQLFRGDIGPWIFHMNWTLDPNEKLKKMSQAGMWYVDDECINELESENRAGLCCLAKPAIKCVIKDKPCAADFV